MDTPSGASGRMDRVSDGIQADSSPDTGGWKPGWDIGLSGGRHAAELGTDPGTLTLDDITGTLGEGERGQPLYVRVNGTLTRVQDYSLMPRRGITVLELDQ